MAWSFTGNLSSAIVAVIISSGADFADIVVVVVLCISSMASQLQADRCSTGLVFLEGFRSVVEEVSGTMDQNSYRLSRCRGLMQE